jgi:hypothetical protein
MSILNSLSKSSLFDSFDDILQLIKAFGEEKNVYLRIDKPITTVKAWNDKVKKYD